jgi:hypothetical protein
MTTCYLTLLLVIEFGGSAFSIFAEQIFLPPSELTFQLHFLRPQDESPKLWNQFIAMGRDIANQKEP